MMADIITDDDHDHFIITEVGAYEAIHSNRDRVELNSNVSIVTSEPVHDDVQYYLADEADVVQCAEPSMVMPSIDAGIGVQQQYKPPHRSTIMNNASASKVPKTIKCPQCRRYFATEPELQAHMLVRHSPEMEERFKCQECQQAFSSQGSLYKHQKIHTGERPFVCDTCNKSFNQLANLQRHFMVHTGEKPFACKTCGKQFSQQSNLDKHQVTHSKIKPFSCKICDKQFTQRANLQKHERVHTGERPFVCPICRKCYAQHANMKKHVLTHNKVNESMAYLCGKCKKLYNTVLQYDAHLDICESLNEDFNFEMITGENEVIGGAGGGVSESDLSATGDNLVIKTEEDLNELLLHSEAHGVDDCLDEDPLMMDHEAEYLDD